MPIKEEIEWDISYDDSVNCIDLGDLPCVAGSITGYGEITNKGSISRECWVVAYVYDRPNDIPLMYAKTGPIRVDPGETEGFTLTAVIPPPQLSAPVCAAYRVDTLLIIGPYIFRSLPRWLSWDYGGPQGVEYLLASGTISSGEEQAVDLKPSAESYEVHIALDWPGSDLDLHVFDAEGRHVGVNYQSGETECEIPGASYSGNTSRPETIRILGPLNSSYTVKIVGIEAEEEPFALSVYELPYIGAGLEAFPDRVDAEVQVGGTWETWLSLQETHGQVGIASLATDPLTLRLNEQAELPVSVELSQNWIEPGGSVLVHLSVATDREAPLGEYKGVLRIRGSVRRDPSVPIEVDIPVTLVFFGVLDETVVRHGPNPVPPEGCIFWLNLPDDAVEATLKIFDVDGALLVSIPLDPATDRYPETGRWIPQDSQGRLLGTGLYLYLVEILHADGPVTYSPVQKMVIQR